MSGGHPEGITRMLMEGAAGQMGAARPSADIHQESDDRGPEIEPGRAAVHDKPAHSCDEIVRG